MGYGNRSGKRPFELASKSAHSGIINTPEVRRLLENCRLPEPAPANLIGPQEDVIPADENPIRAVIAIDGGYTETFVRDDFPSASITFFTLGPLLFSLDDLRRIDRQPFIAPEDMAALRNIERYSVALPTKNVTLQGQAGFSGSFRFALHDFLARSTMGQDSLLHSLRWLLLRQWRAEDSGKWNIPSCPSPRCTQRDLEFDVTTPDVIACPSCSQPVYISDALRLYERIDEEQGAGAVSGYLLTTLEQLVLVHVVRTILKLKRGLLRELLIVKDGPLAFFGLTAPLSRPMRELLASVADDGIHTVGLEKSGSFVDHAAAIEKDLRPGTVFIPSNDYIYTYIEPGDPAVQQYGRNTYYSAKLIYRTKFDDTYVVTVPTGSWKATYSLSDLPNVADSLDAVAQLRCSMYDDALVPIALANKLVSLSDVPSKEILTLFAKKVMRDPQA